MSSPRSRVFPLHALAVYAEPLAAGHRVAVLGDAGLGLEERFEQLGASQTVVAGPDDDLDLLRGRAFDLVVVPDLGAFEDAADLLALVRDLVGDTGAALVAATNRDSAQAEGLGAFDYYELFDLVAGQFDDVRMIAQLPFHGVALAELGEVEESPAVSVDTQLAESDRAPEMFVALASQRGVRLDPYSIVELPEPEAEAAAVDERELQEAMADLAQERLRVEALEVQNSELRAKAARVEELRDRARRVEALEVQNEELRARAARVEELRDKARRTEELERALADHMRQLADRTRQLADLSSEVEELRSAAEAGRVATAQVADLAHRADRAERALGAIEPELSRAVDAHATELLRYEEALRDRAQAIRILESEVARRDQMVRELVDALEEHARQPPPVEELWEEEAAAGSEQEAVGRGREPETETETENAQLRDRLDALALELARREGEAQAAAWNVQELERQVAQAARAQAGAAAADLDRKLATSLDELDALRRALGQEHDARVRAESGEELARARAEIQRQAVLLRQLGHDGEISGARDEELR